MSMRIVYDRTARMNTLAEYFLMSADYQCFTPALFYLESEVFFNDSVIKERLEGTVNF